MNVRFSEQAIRCRATAAELQQLLTGRALSLDLCLPRDRKFRVNVRPAALETWQLESDPTGIWIAIPRSQLQALARRCRARKGSSTASRPRRAGVTVTFEVDLKKSQAEA